MEHPDLTNVSTNSSSTFALTSWQYGPLPSAVVMSLCFLLGVPGNIGVIVLRKSRQNLSRLTQSLMLNLACSDLLCLLSLPLWIYSFIFSWTFGLLACKVLAYFVYCSIYVSLMTVTLMSIQRYIQVVHQQRSLDHMVRRLLVLLWLIGMILATPALVVRQVVEEHQQILCKEQFSSDGQLLAMLLTEILLGYLLPFSVVAFSYIHLNVKVKQASLTYNPRMTRVVTCIIVVFFALWTPYQTVNILAVAAISTGDEALRNFCKASWTVTASFTFLNSCLNPALYAFASTRKCMKCCDTEAESRQISVQTVQLHEREI
ncbi:leukotriene B4 receptor 1-like [Genypterus blacodes]|uniref:leukotriene B4 receptor 1-like n=1 Tax=Genypterus blacodes TaxID=154954 RepID=UPI003F769023